MQFTKEQIQKAMKCGSSCELMALAKANNIAMTEPEAEKYYAQLTGKALSLDDIEAVAGGCTGNACAGNISAAC